MVMQYAILNSDGRCINRVLWDGESNWQPPEGCTAVPDPDNLHPIYVEPQAETQTASETDLSAVLSALTEEQKQTLLNLLSPQ
jgi:hypothetical protein